MRKVTGLFAMLCCALILQACQTTRLSASVDLTTICLALSRSDVLPVLDEEEKALVREHFTRQAKDVLKTPAAIMKELKCAF